MPRNSAPGKQKRIDIVIQQRTVRTTRSIIEPDSRRFPTIYPGLMLSFPGRFIGRNITVVVVSPQIVDIGRCDGVRTVRIKSNVSTSFGGGAAVRKFQVIICTVEQVCRRAAYYIVRTGIRTKRVRRSIAYIEYQFFFFFRPNFIYRIIISLRSAAAGTANPYLYRFGFRRVKRKRVVNAPPPVRAQVLSIPAIRWIPRRRHKPVARVRDFPANNGQNGKTSDGRSSTFQFNVFYRPNNCTVPKVEEKKKPFVPPAPPYPTFYF